VLTIKVVQRGPRPEPPHLGYPPNQQQSASTLSHDHNLIAGPQYMPPAQSANASLQDTQNAIANTMPAPASDASEHTLVQPVMTEPEIKANNTAVHASGMVQNAQLAHPLEDTQTVADKYGQTGALGAGIANAAAALNTRAAHSDQAGRTAVTPAASQPPAAYVGATQATHHQEMVDEGSFEPKVHREPPATMPLHPNSRYCERCELVKPYRSHHCRHCGTCILGMDHHCPWIGQCCGARNHIYFVVFCFWACVSRLLFHRFT
jgi:hypothetical protein